MNTDYYAIDQWKKSTCFPEDDFWNDSCDRYDEAVRDVIADAEAMADLYEFDTDEERDSYINEHIQQGLEELECSFR